MRVFVDFDRERGALVGHHVLLCYGPSLFDRLAALQDLSGGRVDEWLAAEVERQCAWFRARVEADIEALGLERFLRVRLRHATFYDWREHCLTPTELRALFALHVGERWALRVE